MSANPKIVVVDYGVGNLFSVSQAFEKAGTSIVLSDTGAEIENADGLVLPGVGAFSEGMAALRKRDLVQPILSHIDAGKPFLGICLGMQMMLDSSEEFGVHPGLGIIPGKVATIPATGADGKSHKIPHIGWNALLAPEGEQASTAWKDTILAGTSEESAAYFVHSFGAIPSNREHVLADCLYNGRRITAAIRRGKAFGCQFHPEKSGEVGIGVLQEFIAIVRRNAK